MRTETEGQHRRTWANGANKSAVQGEDIKGYIPKGKTGAIRFHGRNGRDKEKARSIGFPRTPLFSGF